MFDYQTLCTQASSLVMAYLPTLIMALVTMILGLWVIKIIEKVLDKSMGVKKFDPSLRTFLSSILSIALKTMLIISVISMLGVKMTSFVALLGAAGLAVGLALQGSLSNFAGGVLVIIFKPFKVGDYIEAAGFAGTVRAIQIFNTTLTTPDNKTIIIPNAQLSNGNIVNYSTEPTRRVDLKFGIGYSDDIAKAKEVIQKIIDDDTRIFKSPAPQVRLSELGDSSVNFVVRVWSDSANYWDIFFEMTEKVKLAFDANGISIPFPQRDVHVYNH